MITFDLMKYASCSILSQSVLSAVGLLGLVDITKQEMMNAQSGATFDYLGFD